MVIIVVEGEGWLIADQQCAESCGASQMDGVSPPQASNRNTLRCNNKNFILIVSIVGK